MPSAKIRFSLAIMKSQYGFPTTWIFMLPYTMFVVSKIQSYCKIAPRNRELQIRGSSWTSMS